MNKLIIAAVIVLTVFVSVGFFYWQKNTMVMVIEPTPSPVTTTFGNDKIRVISPVPNQIVESPLQVNGKAVGIWYFEASFPVKLLDGNGKLIASTPAQAQSDWMTEDFVPFKATLIFDNPGTTTGTLVFQKDNPSGLPEHEEEIRMPIRFNN